MNSTYKSKELKNRQSGIFSVFDLFSYLTLSSRFHALNNAHVFFRLSFQFLKITDLTFYLLAASSLVQQLGMEI